MWKKGLKMLLVAAISAALIGCGNNGGDKPSDSGDDPAQETVDTEQNTDPDKNEADNPDKEQPDTESEEKNPEENIVAETGIDVYFSNEDATGFTTETVKLESLSAEEVLNALIEKGAVAADVKLLSLKQSQKDGEEVLDLDFTAELGTYLNSLGTTGEYMTIGSICNTYLEAYGCQKIKITVKGETLATGHAEYPGYMEKFK